GHCNTTIRPDDKSSAGMQAGKLRVEFRNFKPGLYRVDLAYNYKIVQERTTGQPVGAIIDVNISDGQGEMRAQESAATANSRGLNWVSGGQLLRQVPVRVDSEGRAVVIELAPAISGKRGGAKFIGEVIIIQHYWTLEPLRQPGIWPATCIDYQG